MTNEIAKVLAGSLEPMVNQRLITVLCGLTKVAQQKRDTLTLRFPVPYDYDSATYQIENSALVPDAKERAIVYFEGNDTDVAGFSQKRSQGRTSLRLVCWYDRSKYQSPDNDSVHTVLMSQFLEYLGSARPPYDGVIATFQVDVTRIYDSVESLFSKYTYRQERSQYLLSPYFALGIDITVSYQINHGCRKDLLPVNTAACC